MTELQGEASKTEKIKNKNKDSGLKINFKAFSNTFGMLAFPLPSVVGVLGSECQESPQQLMI